ncbi:hypothetical protein SMITH_301 [Smithella sp. ME-1]|nr:hypothetical protein SMITH_301 [Smithella sp. ME-1]
MNGGQALKPWFGQFFIVESCDRRIFFSVKNKTGIAFLTGHIAGIKKKLLSVFLFPDILCDMQKRTRKNKRFTFRITLLKYFHYRAGKTLCITGVIAIIFTCRFSFCANGGKFRPVRGHFIIYVNIGIESLTAARGRELRKFIYQHLRKLFYFPVRHGSQIRRERDINRVPTDCTGKMPLQNRAEAHHMRQKNFGVFRRIGGIYSVGKFQSVYFQVFQRLTAAIRTVNVTQRVNVNISGNMSLADSGCKNIIQ